MLNEMQIWGNTSCATYHYLQKYIFNAILSLRSSAWYSISDTHLNDIVMNFG